MLRELLLVSYISLWTNMVFHKTKLYLKSATKICKQPNLIGKAIAGSNNNI